MAWLRHRKQLGIGKTVLWKRSGPVKASLVTESGHQTLAESWWASGTAAGRGSDATVTAISRIRDFGSGAADRDRRDRGEPTFLAYGQILIHGRVKFGSNFGLMTGEKGTKALLVRSCDNTFPACSGGIRIHITAVVTIHQGTHTRVP